MTAVVGPSVKRPISQVPKIPTMEAFYFEVLSGAYGKWVNIYKSVDGGPRFFVGKGRKETFALGKAKRGELKLPKGVQLASFIADTYLEKNGEVTVHKGSVSVVAIKDSVSVTEWLAELTKSNQKAEGKAFWMENITDMRMEAAFGGMFSAEKVREALVVIQLP
jgi:hypothetical protein